MYSVRNGEVLIVNSPNVIKAVKITLHHKGYTVVGCKTEQEAINHVTSHVGTNQSNNDISVLLTHVDMENGLDGTEIAERIIGLYHQNGHNKRPPVVVFTAGYCDGRQKERAKQLTSIPVVEDPLDAQTLIRLVNNANHAFYNN